MKKLLFLLSLFLFIPFVSADEINVGYVTDYTTLTLVSGNSGFDLEPTITNSYNVDINRVVIYVQHSIDNDTEYILELSTPNAKFTNVNSFSIVGYNRPNQISCTFIKFDNSDNAYPKIHFRCDNYSSEYFTIQMSNSSNLPILTNYDFRWNYTYLRWVTNNSNQDIIDNQNQNTQDIINNANQNTQDIIDSQRVCTLYDKTNIKDDNKYLTAGGSVSNASTLGITDYIDISQAVIIPFITNSDNVGFCFYNSEKTLISCTTNASMVVGQEMTIPSGAYFFRATIRKATNTPQFKVCTNGNQATNDAINGLNDSLTDDSSIDMSSIGNTAGWLPAGPIDSIINLPLNFFNSISSALSGTCQPLTITIPYLNKTITIPCLSTIFGQIQGLTIFWNWVGRIASVYILYRYLLALWDYYDRLTTLQVNFRDDFGGGV